VKAVFNRCQLYLAGSTGFNEGSDEDFLFGRALQQPPIYGPDDLDFEVVAGALLEVSVDDNNTPDFEWNKLTHTEQLNNNSLVRRTIRCDEEE
jgi:hypothetical protein